MNEIPGATPGGASGPDAGVDIGEGDEPPGGPWKSWPAIYATLAVWGVLCILFLIWVTGALNVDLCEDDVGTAEAADVELPEALR